ncbi:MAG: hypothetical protein K6E84_09530, partial [Lachnospiraceae bacterium]|nr:hypothetical protein [Lachnospiraceae bacterium]
LWNETKGKKTVLKYQVVDSNGKVVYKKTYKNTPFDPGSQPILTNGYIQWVSGQRGTKVVKTFWYSYTTYTDTVGKPKTVRIPAKY